jgi:hypothetical protein
MLLNVKNYTKSEFKLSHRTDEISRLEALALSEWIYIVFEKISEETCTATYLQLGLGMFFFNNIPHVPMEIDMY